MSRNATDELLYRLIWTRNRSKMRPSKSLPISRKGLSYRISANFAYETFVYERALGINNFENSLKLSSKLLSKSLTIYSKERAQCLSGLVKCGLLLKDKVGIGKACRKLLESYEETGSIGNVDKYVLEFLIAAIFLEEDTGKLFETLVQTPKRPKSYILKSTVGAIESLIADDQEQFYLDVDNVLSEHVKQANSAKSRIFNTVEALSCQHVLLLLNLAEIKGFQVPYERWNVQHDLRIGLSSPADFPSLPKNLKIPLKVNYINGHVVS